MKIAAVRTTPLFLACRQPYHWAQGVNEGTEMVLVEVDSDEGLTGIGEAAATPNAAAFESGITTCAANQAAATIPNLDDGNQIMWQILAEDLISAPDLTPMAGRLPVLDGPGLGFELDRDAVARAAEAYRRRA